MRWTRSASSDTAETAVPPEAAVPAGPDAGGARRRDGFWDGVHRLLPVARVVMEFCWLFPWLVVIGGGIYGGPGAPLLSPGWTLALVLIAQAAVRVVGERAGSLRRARVALIGAGVVLGLLAVHGRHFAQIPAWHPAWIAALLRAAHDIIPEIPAPVAAAFLATCLWWRGLVLGARSVTAAEIEEAYKTGVGMIVLYLLAAAVYADARGFAAAGPDLPASMLAFFFLGLSALSLARLATIWDAGRPDERAQSSGRIWLFLIVGVVGIILFAASMMAGLAAADVTRYLGLALRPLLPLLEVIFLVLFFVASLIVRVLIAVLTRIPRRQPVDLRDQITPIDDLLRRLRELDMHPMVVESARWGMLAVLLLLLVIGMAITIVLLRRQEKKRDEDERESVWSTREALQGLARLLGRLRVRRRSSGERSLSEVHAIRMAYREVLRLGAALGAPRQAWATPREHLPRLQGALPDAGDDVDWLTGAYERVRYGDWRPAREEVRGAQAALERIRAAAPSSDSSEEQGR